MLSRKSEQPSILPSPQGSVEGRRQVGPVQPLSDTAQLSPLPLLPIFWSHNPADAGICRSYDALRFGSEPIELKNKEFPVTSTSQCPTISHSATDENEQLFCNPQDLILIASPRYRQDSEADLIHFINEEMLYQQTPMLDTSFKTTLVSEIGIAARPCSQGDFLHFATELETDDRSYLLGCSSDNPCGSLACIGFCLSHTDVRGPVNMGETLDTNAETASLFSPFSPSLSLNLGCNRPEDLYQWACYNDGHSRNSHVINTTACDVESRIDHRQAITSPDYGLVSRRKTSEITDTSSTHILPTIPSRRCNQVHNGDPGKQYACSLCSRRFRRKEHLTRHFRTVHSLEKPFRCEECGKGFSRSDNLTQHGKLHTHRTDFQYEQTTEYLE